LKGARLGRKAKNFGQYISDQFKKSVEARKSRRDITQEVPLAGSRATANVVYDRDKNDRSEYLV